MLRQVVTAAIAACVLAQGALAQETEPRGGDRKGGVTIRVAAWHLPGIRSDELRSETSVRVKRIAQVLQRVRPNVVVISGLAYDVPGAPGVPKDSKGGENATRFAERFLAKPQAQGLAPLSMTAVMPMTNSGQASGLDLDRSGSVVNTFVDDKGKEGAASGFSGDAWGPGAYPGQFGVAILVDARLSVGAVGGVEGLRTFRLMPWDYVPGAFLPKDPDGDGAWFSDEAKKVVRLSSTTHVDAPVRLPNGAVLRVLASNPASLGGVDVAERRARRNFDEIRFWADYVDGGSYIVDDESVGGAIADDAMFVILGNLNAAPGESAAFRDPVQSVLFATSRINTSVTPRSDDVIPGLDPTDTTRDGHRHDYVLPSRNVGIAAAGIWRLAPTSEASGEAVPFPAEHFPVWMDLWIPDPPGGR